MKPPLNGWLGRMRPVVSEECERQVFGGLGIVLYRT